MLADINFNLDTNILLGVVFIVGFLLGAIFMASRRNKLYESAWERGNYWNDKYRAEVEDNMKDTWWERGEEPPFYATTFDDQEEGDDELAAS